MNYTIDACGAGQTIKQYLTRGLGLSRRTISLLKYRDRGITVNGEHKTVRYVLCEGDELNLFYEDFENTTNISPSLGEIDVIYEDDVLLCVNKPPFLPMHPSRGGLGDTLAARVVAYMGNPFVFRASTRLDRNTSGVVVVSKDRLVSANMAKLFADRKVDKVYLAIVIGNLKERSGKSGFIDYNIRRQNGSIITREATSATEGEGGKNSPFGASALTRYTVLDSTASHSLVVAYPMTGRTHQLRVHFAAAGYPILGDDLYGQASPVMARQALHACRLSFAHPATGEPLHIFAPLGEDFLEALHACGLKGCEQMGEVKQNA
ncbi:MAG TPA: hypothetical protein DER23_10435 [Clostridiales bacterium]|jgi:23S rRNA pseudouridine1911/1915/1917 synthase|nr:hypothetical protein [Clostridiales bacterium]